MCGSKTVCVFVRAVIVCYACTLELRRINIRNVLMSDDSCQVKWGSVMRDNTVLPMTVWILQVGSEHKLVLCSTERQNILRKAEYPNVYIIKSYTIWMSG